MTDCPLTEKELACVRWLADGHHAHDIADIASRSIWTIRKHIENAHDKTGSATSAGLVAMALRRGWIS